MKKDKDKRDKVSTEKIIKAFAKNAQVQRVVDAMKEAAHFKGDDYRSTFRIELTQEGVEMSLEEGKSKATIFDGKKSEKKELPPRKEELLLNTGMKSSIVQYVEAAYAGLEPKTASDTAQKVVDLISDSVVTEVERAIKIVWEERTPKKAGTEDGS